MGRQWPFTSVARATAVTSITLAVDMGTMPTQIDSFHSVAAVDRVREERDLVQKEIDAFGRFESRVEQVPCVSGVQSTSTVPAGGITVQTVATPVQKLENAYRTTIMSTPHYEAEYGDTLEESVRTEFDEAISQVVTGAVPYTPLAKSRLLNASEAARHRRSTLLDDLDRERTDLSTALTQFEEWTTEMRRIHERITQWPDCWASEELARLDQIHEACESLSAERQQRIRRHAGCGWRGVASAGFVQYLYQDASFSMPILADISSICRQLDDERRRLHQKLAGGRD